MAAAPHANAIPPSDSILFILVCFSAGVLIRLGLKWTRVPYTAMLLLVGVAIGFLQLAHPATQAFTNTLKLWLAMEPHLLLLIFLPIIGFSAAIAQEPHMLRKSWGQIMLLAWPGVVVQFLLIALCAKYFFPYGWSWPEAFLFGAMMSATDPVAVVAVLQEVGASQKLACVIDGESLMNDGSALVIFLVLQKIVEGQAVTVGGAIAQFCLLAVVGMLLGIACGLATSWLLEHIFRDPTLTTIVTLLSAYSSYYVADRLVGASGLLAVVLNGFTMSLIGGRELTMRVEDSMHAFWGVLEWGANTILFVWMGIVLAIVLPPSHEKSEITNIKVHLVPTDAGYVVVLFLWLQVARAVLLALCWWPFRYTGYPLTWRTALVYLWGGLRGAVGMVMALFVFLDEEIHNESFRSYCIFYMGTMAFFTVLLNGGTVKWLLQVLGFMSYTPEQLTTLQHVVQDMDSIREHRLKALGPDDVLGEPEPDVVKVWTSLPTSEMLSEAAARTVRPPLNPRSHSVIAAKAAGLDAQLLYDYRCRILHMVKAYYAEAYSQHLLSTPQVRTLQAASDKALDEAGDGLRDWDHLQPQCILRGLPRLLRAWKLHLVSGTLVQTSVYQQQLSNLTLMIGFIHAHKHAQEVLRDHIQAVGDAPVIEALSRPSSFVHSVRSGDSFDPMKELLERFNSLAPGKGGRGGAEALYVLQESEAAAAAAQKLAEYVTRSHPSLPAWLRSKQVAASILTEQHGFLQHLADAGLVQAREAMALDDLMQERFRSLLQSNTVFSAALSYSRSRPPINLVPLFDSLDDAQAAALMQGASRGVSWGPKDSRKVTGAGAHRCYWKVFYPEQQIAAAGGRIEEVIVITKGAVRMDFPAGGVEQQAGVPGGTKEHTVVASVGDPLGVCELMLGYRRLADLTADSMVQCLMVPAEVFMELVKTVPGVDTRAWQATAAQLAAQHHHILGEHRQLAPLNMFFRSCFVERIRPGETFAVPRTALLLTGMVRSLLPLPASFSLAVANPKRSTSAADLLWPSNITSSGSEGSQSHHEGSSRHSGQGMAQHSSSGSLDSGSMARQQSAPVQFAAQHLSSQGSLPSQQLLHQQSAPGVDQGLESNGRPAAAADVRHAGANGVAGPAAAKQGAAVAAGDDASVLAAPAELPPGEFTCTVAAMVLQVPRGPRVPGSLETITYQAHVLGRGSTHPDLRKEQAAAPVGSQSVGLAAAAANSSSGRQEAGKKALATHSWSPQMSPFKDALQKLSRISRGGATTSSLQTQPSDTLPTMHFLQKAATAMRVERQHSNTAPRTSAANGAGAAGASQALHTVVEVRGASLQGAAAEAAVQRALHGSTAAAAGAGGSGSATGSQGSQQQQQRSLQRPSPSFELRATDVVLSNANVRKRMIAGQSDGSGSPRAAAADMAASEGSGTSPEAAGLRETFIPRAGWSTLGSTGPLTNSLKRRSANYT